MDDFKEKKKKENNKISNLKYSAVSFSVSNLFSLPFS